MMNAAHHDLLTVDEAALALRQSPATIRRKIADGSLPAMRLGEFGPLRVPAESLDQHLRPITSKDRRVVVSRGEDARNPAPPAAQGGRRVDPSAIPSREVPPSQGPAAGDLGHPTKEAA